MDPIWILLLLSGVLDGVYCGSRFECIKAAMAKTSAADLFKIISGSSDSASRIARCFESSFDAAPSAYAQASSHHNEGLGSAGDPFLGVQRIYQGSDARVWPHHVGICIDGEVACGGSLIHDEWVVTAAHCLETLNGDHSARNLARRGVKVLLGARLLRVSPQSDNPKHYESCNFPRGDEQLEAAAAVVPHPAYRAPLAASNDVALIRLAAPAIRSDAVAPIALQLAVEPILPGEECWVMGWGVTEGFAESSRLQEAEIKIRPHPDCLDIYGVEKIDHTMFCAGEVEGIGANTCRGDSGGSLVCRRSSEWILAGVTSFGDPCGTQNAPGVYANMDRLLGFISQTVFPNHRPLTGLSVVAGRKGSPLACPTDFYRVPQNIQAVVGSTSRVFLCYSRSGSGAAIRDLRVVFSYRETPTCPRGWFDLDLSDPATRRQPRMPRVKLCYSKSPLDGRGPVTDLISIMRYWEYEAERNPSGYTLLQPPVAFDYKKIIFLAFQTQSLS